MVDQITLYGRLFVRGEIAVLSGMHIGGSEAGFSIGALDKPVILDPMTDRPYIPGSSLRGKMRSLSEKYMGLPLRSLGKVRIHQPNREADYLNSPVAQIYGIPAEDFSLPTRLIVRDVPITENSAEQLRRSKTELPYTEVKTEVSIDRITSQANPRQIERVPAGAIFGPMELVFSFYRPEDVDLLTTLFDGLLLVEDDYLGGHGSRGYGKIKFQNLTLDVKQRERYAKPERVNYASLDELIASVETIRDEVADLLFGA